MTDKPEPIDDSPENEEAAVPAPAGSKASRRGGLAVGAAAVGIGSAAVVAALLYVRHRQRGRVGDA